MDEEYEGRWVFTRYGKDYRPRYIYYHNGDYLETIEPGWKISNEIGNDLFYAECNTANIFNCSNVPGSGIDINTCVTYPTSPPTPECLDYGNHSTNNGQDIIFTVRSSYSLPLLHNDTELHKGDLRDSIIECNDSNSDICFVACYLSGIHILSLLVIE